VLERTLPRRFGRADARYKVRKFVVFSGYLSILLFLAVLFQDRLGRLNFAFGVVGAGVAVALQDVLASIAGAFSIGFSKLYAVGDRVQIGDTRGDVIDIGLLRTTLMETGNRVSRDLYNGRIVRIPNSTVLKGSVFNYSQGFRFVRTQGAGYPSEVDPSGQDQESDRGHDLRQPVPPPPLRL
jgi:small-conductance mechanosensitive channel